MKFYSMRLCISKNKKGLKVETAYHTVVCLGDESNFIDILCFQDNAKKIWKKAMNAVREKMPMQLSVEVSVYDELNNNSFNRWVSVPVEEQDDKGIYLRADEKYTDPNIDMRLGKDVLRDLEYTVGKVE